MENPATASKKRKLYRDEEQEEENEDEKMEKFYALVKNIREARESLMNRSYATKEKENNIGTKRSKLVENKMVQVWKPTFQREDFVEETHTMNHSIEAASSQIEQETGKEEIKEGLDLTLSL